MAVLLNIPKGENNTYLEFFVTDVPGTWWIDSEEKDQGWPSKLPEDRELLFRLELDILDSLVAASGIRWPLGEYFWDRYDSRTEDGRSSIQFWVEHFEKMATKISETPGPALLEEVDSWSVHRLGRPATPEAIREDLLDTLHAMRSAISEVIALQKTLFILGV